MNQRKNIAIMGSTGSVGKSALDVVRSLNQSKSDASPMEFNVVGLSGHSNLDLLCQQAQEFNADSIVAADDQLAAEFDFSNLASVDVRRGHDSLVELASREDVDIVLAAIVGSAGLPSTWAAIEKGKTIALANKETLVVAGAQVMKLAGQTGSKILPVDSEHSAVFQALKAKGESVSPLECPACLLYTSPSPRDGLLSRMPSSA